MPLESIALPARGIFALCALILLGIILVLIRRHAIKEKYVLLWLPLGIGFLVLSVFPEILVWTARKAQLHYITVVVLGIIFVFTAILLYFTVRMSQMREDTKKLAQELALLRAAGTVSPAAPAQDSGWVPAGKREVVREDAAGTGLKARNT